MCISHLQVGKLKFVVWHVLNKIQFSKNYVLTYLLLMIVYKIYFTFVYESTVFSKLNTNTRRLNSTCVLLEQKLRRITIPIVSPPHIRSNFTWRFCNCTFSYNLKS